MKNKCEIQLQQSSQTYILVLEDEDAPLNSHLRRRVLAIASQEAPHLVSGFAVRVGWIRHLDQEPIYRLRVLVQPAHAKMVTLPDVFVLEHDAFVEYLPTDVAFHSMVSESAGTMDVLP